MREETPSIGQLCQALSRLLGVTEPAMIADLKTINESERLLRSALDELATLRARVAEMAAWRERAMPVMQALTQMCESVVVNARDPELALKFLDDVIEELGPTAFALLGEGGQ